MDDDRLTSELQRRASGASRRPDWAQRDLLPAVWREIDTRPQPVLASRWSPLAGVATLVVALLVLAVAVPRLGPQPPSATSTPASPLFLTTADFASRLAAGEIDGKTVLVDGGIVAYDGPPIFGSYCGPNGPACIVGQLEGVTPRIVVSSPDIAVASSGDSAVQHSPGWPWWMRVAPPIHGTLLLSVGDVGGVKYMGRVLMNGDNPAWSVGDAAALDINLLERDQLVLVDGWLIDTEPPGSFVSIDCVPRQFPDLDGLPSRYCQPADFLSSEQPTGEVAPDSAARLQVQRAAAKSFGGRNSTDPATFAIAPRLYGGGCSAAPPCWVWNVVARVDTTAAVAPTPTPTAPAASLVDCGSKPNAFDPSLIYVADASGAVRSCKAESGMAGGWPAGDTSVLVQPIGDATNEIEVAWATDRCRPERVLIEVKRSGSSFAVRVIVDRSGGDGWECVDVGTRPPRHADLTLAESIDPANVSVDLVIVPDTHVDLPQTFECEWAEPAGEGSPAPSRVPTIVDHTGAVTRCMQLAPGAPAAGAVDVTNVNGFDAIRFDWVDTTCDGPIEADFQAVADGYELAVQEPSEPCLTGGPIAIVVNYRIPMPAELVAADFKGPPPVFACADAPSVTVVDEAGVVASCAASENGASPAEGDLVIENPGADTSALQLSWVGASCGYEVHVATRGDKYAVLIYTTCAPAGVVQTVTLQLSTPIRADQVNEWSIGGPPRTPSPPASPTQTPGPSSTATAPAPTEPRILSTGEFEAALSAGTLSGRTVLVNGSVPEIGNGTGCSPPPPSFRCVLGVLAGTVSRIHVWYERWPEKENDGAHFEGGDITWPWWGGPDWPVEGTLLLRVTDAGVVQFIGRAHDPQQELVRSVADAAALDVNSIDQEEVVLVDGWLNGIDAFEFCPAELHRIEGLLTHDWCARGAWLTPEATVLNPHGFSVPAGSIHLQSQAFDDFAQQPGLRDGQVVVPQRAIYAITRRLFGDGRGYPEPPNWGWAVVARVD